MRPGHSRQSPGPSTLVTRSCPTGCLVDPRPRPAGSCQRTRAGRRACVWLPGPQRRGCPGDYLRAGAVGTGCTPAWAGCCRRPGPHTAAGPAGWRGFGERCCCSESCWDVLAPKAGRMWGCSARLHPRQWPSSTSLNSQAWNRAHPLALVCVPPPHSHGGMRLGVHQGNVAIVDGALQAQAARRCLFGGLDVPLDLGMWSGSGKGGPRKCCTVIPWSCLLARASIRWAAGRAQLYPLPAMHRSRS